MLGDVHKVGSHGGNLINITFIVSCIKKTWAYFMIHEFEAFSHSKHFQSLVEREYVCKFEILRVERGKQYRSNVFRNYYLHFVSEWHFTTNYTPQ